MVFSYKQLSHLIPAICFLDSNSLSDRFEKVCNTGIYIRFVLTSQRSYPLRHVSKNMFNILGIKRSSSGWRWIHIFMVFFFFLSSEKTGSGRISNWVRFSHCLRLLWMKTIGETHFLFYIQYVYWWLWGNKTWSNEHMLLPKNIFFFWESINPQTKRTGNERRVDKNVDYRKWQWQLTK